MIFFKNVTSIQYLNVPNVKTYLHLFYDSRHEIAPPRSFPPPSTRKGREIMAGPVGEWYKDSNNFAGVLLDIYGVLYDDSDEGPVAIQGSVEAINK